MSLTPWVSVLLRYLFLAAVGCDGWNFFILLKSVMLKD
jgi:hypothetical protein